MESRMYQSELLSSLCLFFQKKIPADYLFTKTKVDIMTRGIPHSSLRLKLLKTF